MMIRGKKGIYFPIFLAVAAGLAAVVMLLWNALIPAVIGWSAVTYWQALGLLVLCRLLLGGFGRMNHWHARPGDSRMRDMHRKMCKMSREERRDFIRSRMEGFGGPKGETTEETKG